MSEINKNDPRLEYGNLVKYKGKLWMSCNIYVLWMSLYTLKNRSEFPTGIRCVILFCSVSHYREAPVLRMITAG